MPMERYFMSPLSPRSLSYSARIFFASGRSTPSSSVKGSIAISPSILSAGSADIALNTFSPSSYSKPPLLSSLPMFICIRQREVTPARSLRLESSSASSNLSTDW